MAEPQMPSAVLDEASDTVSTTSSDDIITEDLQQLWKEALEQCEQVEHLQSTIICNTLHLQQSISIEEMDCIMVTYKGVHQDLMDVLHSIHTTILENSNKNVGSILLDMLESCEFKQ